MYIKKLKPEKIGRFYSFLSLKFIFKKVNYFFSKLSVFFFCLIEDWLSFFPLLRVSFELLFMKMFRKISKFCSWVWLCFFDSTDKSFKNLNRNTFINSFKIKSDRNISQKIYNSDVYRGGTDLRNFTQICFFPQC